MKTTKHPPHYETSSVTLTEEKAEKQTTNQKKRIFYLKLLICMVKYVGYRSSDLHGVYDYMQLYKLVSRSLVFKICGLSARR